LVQPPQAPSGATCAHESRFENHQPYSEVTIHFPGTCQHHLTLGNGKEERKATSGKLPIFYHPNEILEA
jgi:hypothetical protein